MRDRGTTMPSPKHLQLKYSLIFNGWCQEFLGSELGIMLHGMHACSLAQLHLTLWDLWTVAPQGPLSMNYSGKNTGVGCHFFLQGIFPTQSEHMSPALTGGFFTSSATQEAPDGAILNLTFQWLTLILHWLYPTVLKLCKSHISISQYFCNFVTIMIIQINLLILTAKLPENNLGMKYN